MPAIIIRLCMSRIHYQHLRVLSDNVTRVGLQTLVWLLPKLAPSHYLAFPLVVVLLCVYLSYGDGFTIVFLSSCVFPGGGNCVASTTTEPQRADEDTQKAESTPLAAGSETIPGMMTLFQ